MPPVGTWGCYHLWHVGEVQWGWRQANGKSQIRLSIFIASLLPDIYAVLSVWPSNAFQIACTTCKSPSVIVRYINLILSSLSFHITVHDITSALKLQNSFRISALLWMDCVELGPKTEVSVLTDIHQVGTCVFHVSTCVFLYSYFYCLLFM